VDNARARPQGYVDSGLKADASLSRHRARAWAITRAGMAAAGGLDAQPAVPDALGVHSWVAPPRTCGRAARGALLAEVGKEAQLPNSSNNVFASCKSFVSNPSVNQP